MLLYAFSAYRLRSSGGMVAFLSITGCLRLVRGRGVSMLLVVSALLHDCFIVVVVLVRLQKAVLYKILGHFGEVVK